MSRIGTRTIVLPNRIVINACHQFIPAVINPDAMTWVIVGDRSKIEAGLRELNIGEIRVVDADGAPVK